MMKLITDSNLDIASPCAFTAITLYDARYNEIGTGVGTLKAKVGAGLYKVVWRDGNQANSVLLKINSDSEKRHIQLSDLGFNLFNPYALQSPKDFPIFLERHMRLRARTGRGAGLLLVVGSLSATLADPVNERLSSRVTLRDLSGAIVYNFSNAVFERFSEQEYVLVSCVEVEPGPYRLRFEADQNEMVICLGRWITQLFVEEKEIAGGRTIDLKTATISSCRLADPSLASYDEMKALDIVTLCLQEGRPFGPKKNFNSLFEGVKRNPLSSLVYLLNYAVSCERQWDDATTVVRDVTTMDMLLRLNDGVDDIPDLKVLRYLNSNTSARTIPVIPYPPMFKSTWQLLMGRQFIHDSTVPYSSLTSNVIGNLWGNSHLHVWKLDTALRECDHEVSVGGDGKSVSHFTDEAGQRLERLREQDAARLYFLIANCGAGDLDKLLSGTLSVDRFVIGAIAKLPLRFIEGVLQEQLDDDMLSAFAYMQIKKRLEDEPNGEFYETILRYQLNQYADDYLDHVEESLLAAYVSDLLQSSYIALADVVVITTAIRLAKLPVKKVVDIHRELRLPPYTVVSAVTKAIRAFEELLVEV